MFSVEDVVKDSDPEVKKRLTERAKLIKLVNDSHKLPRPRRSSYLLFLERG